MAMPARASMLLPSKTAVRMLLEMRSMPSRASGSVCMVALTEV